MSEDPRESAGIVRTQVIGISSGGSRTCLTCKLYPGARFDCGRVVKKNGLPGTEEERANLKVVWAYRPGSRGEGSSDREVAMCSQKSVARPQVALTLDGAKGCPICCNIGR